MKDVKALTSQRAKPPGQAPMRSTSRFSEEPFGRSYGRPAHNDTAIRSALAPGAAPIEPTDRAERLAVLWAGMAIVLASVIGGGTTSYLISDRLIQLALWPLGLYGLLRAGRCDWDVWPKLWVSLLLLLLMTTVLAVVYPPVYRTMELVGLPVPMNRSAALSYSLFGLSVAGFLVFVSTLSDCGRMRILLMFLVGVLINLTVAGVQLSTLRPGGAAGAGDVWFYPQGIGFFSNQNHFSAFLYAVLPAIAWLFIDRIRLPLVYVLVAVVMIVVLFAAGSYAAMGLVTALFAVCYLLFWQDRYGQRLVSPWLGLAILLLLLPLVGVLWLQAETEAAPGLRAQFWRNTWAAIGDHWPIGAGFGGFHLVYPRYETADQDLSVFANYAHNDWLELLLDGGMWALALMVGAIALLVRHAGSAPHKSAAAIGLLALLLHSLVDYPMRTMAVAMLAAFLFGVLLSRTPAQAVGPAGRSTGLS